MVDRYSHVYWRLREAYFAGAKRGAELGEASEPDDVLTGFETWLNTPKPEHKREAINYGPKATEPARAG
jgi:hypothetical protein